MARIILNPAIQIISGDVGGFVYRQRADGSITLAKQPLPNPDRVPTEAQAEQQQNFKQAAARYQRLMEDPAIRAAYEQVLAGRGPMARLRAMVIGDILKPPTISDLDVSNYRGAAGNTIRVLAEDSVGVARLELAIRDQASGQDLETAEKAFSALQLASAVEWLYTTNTAVAPGDAVEVKVTAYDLAGNKVETSLPVQA